MSIYWMAPLASLATLLGGWSVVRFLQGRAQFMRLISGVAAGYLLSVTLVRIIPECMEARGGEANAMWVLGGYLLVHVMEHGITLHFHYGEETHTGGSPLSGVMALVGLSLHSLMDGVAIAAALSIQGNLGPLVVLGILFHRIPEGGTIASIFLVDGFGNRGALLASGTLALAALIGSAGQTMLSLPTGPILGLTAGLTLYVASSDLLPEVQKVSGFRSTLALLSGVGIFLVSARLLPHSH